MTKAHNVQIIGASSSVNTLIPDVSPEFRSIVAECGPLCKKNRFSPSKSKCKIKSMCKCYPCSGTTVTYLTVLYTKSLSLNLRRKITASPCCRFSLADSVCWSVGRFTVLASSGLESMNPVVKPVCDAMTARSSMMVSPRCSAKRGCFVTS